MAAFPCIFILHLKLKNLPRCLTSHGSIIVSFSAILNFFPNVLKKGWGFRDSSGSKTAKTISEPNQKNRCASPIFRATMKSSEENYLPAISNVCFISFRGSVLIRQVYSPASSICAFSIIKL